MLVVLKVWAIDPLDDQRKIMEPKPAKNVLLYCQCLMKTVKYYMEHLTVLKPIS